MLRSLSLFLASLGVLAFGGKATADPAPLGFGVVPTESAVGLRRDYEPLRRELSAALGQPVEMFFAPDYTGIIEAMRFGKVQVGVFGNNAAIDAVDRAGGEVFAQQIDKDGNPGYWSVIVVHKTSPVNSLEELLAKRSELSLAMGDPQSTSGTLVPGFFAFARNGVNPVREFRAFRRSHHEANVLSVAKGQIDACTANNETLFRLEQKLPAMAAEVKVIWKGPMIAMDAIVYKSDLPNETKARLRTFFENYGRTVEQRASLAPLKLSGFRPSSDAQLLPYRLMRLERDKADAETDSRLTEPERQGRLNEIEQKRREYEKELEASKASPGVAQR